MIRNQSAGSLSPELEQGEPDWIKKMRDHYRRTGFYRAEDVQRVLGDPRKPFQGKALDDLLMASQIGS